MAHALKFHALVSGKTLPLPDLSAFEGKQVEVIVVEDEGHEQGIASVSGNSPRQRPLGLYRGQFIVPDDFDAPLPPDVLEVIAAMPPGNREKAEIDAELAHERSDWDGRA